MRGAANLATTAAVSYFTGGASLLGGSPGGGISDALGSGGGGAPTSSSATGGKAEAALNEGSWSVSFAPGIGGISGPANLFRAAAEPFPLSIVAALGIAAALVGVLLWTRKKS